MATFSQSRLPKKGEWFFTKWMQKLQHGSEYGLTLSTKVKFSTSTSGRGPHMTTTTLLPVNPLPEHLTFRKFPSSSAATVATTGTKLTSGAGRLFDPSQTQCHLGSLSIQYPFKQTPSATRSPRPLFQGCHKKIVPHTSDTKEAARKFCYEMDKNNPRWYYRWMESNFTNMKMCIIMFGRKKSHVFSPLKPMCWAGAFCWVTKKATFILATREVTPVTSPTKPNSSSSTFLACEDHPVFFSWKNWLLKLKRICDTVDGWNPKQPPGMYRTL